MLVRPRSEAVDENDPVYPVESVRGMMFCNVIHAPGR